MYSIFGSEYFRLILLGSSSLLVFIYWFLTRNFNYWTKLGVSGPTPIIFFGNFLDRILNPIALLDDKNFKTFGNIYGIFDGMTPVLHVADPELIKLVLIKDFHYFKNRRGLETYHPIINRNVFHSRDEDWDRMRSFMSAAFSSEKMKGLFNLVRECLQKNLIQWEVFADLRSDIDLKLMSQNFTLDVIAACAFATKVNANKSLSNPFVENCRKIFDFKAKKMIPQFIFPKFLNNLLNITSPVDESASQWIFDLIRQILTERRNGAKNNDFIQSIIDAKPLDSNILRKNDGLETIDLNEGVANIGTEKKAININCVKKSLTEEEIIAQCFTFLLAGFETTATTLTYALYLLAMHDDSQERIYSEIISAIDSNREINYETLHDLPFLDAFIKETLRLYSPFVRLEREVKDDYILGDTGIKLFKGQLVEIPIYAIHHSEQYYQNADQFIPQRFLAKNRPQLVPYTYLPFGMGPRNCVGMRFALLEVKLAIAHIVMRFRLKRCDKTATEVQFQNLTFLLSTKNIFVTIEKR